MSFFEKCPNCNALVHFKKDNRCSNCGESYTKEERNSLKVEKIIQCVDEQTLRPKYRFLQITTELLSFLSLIVFILGIIGVIYGLSTLLPSRYSDLNLFDYIKYVLLFIISIFGGIIGGLIIYLMTEIIQVYIDMEEGIRLNNSILKKLVGLFKE
ncbi:MAG: hypothetical protein KAW56_00635 [Candidatus Marinimicrobia bacterium]|nr:hypothetical protein [Candidatus Neomarinimicrobiota bacterium]